MRRFFIHTIIPALLCCSCLNYSQTATTNDLYVSGISNRKLLLDGSEGSQTKFYIKTNYDWKIIDNKRFSCSPSSGTKSSENITITATPLQANNSGDTIYLSPLNFKMLSTRFVGISAYQLPQIIVSTKSLDIESVEGSTATLTFRTKCNPEDITPVASNENLSAKIAPSGKIGDYTKCTVTITAHSSNISTDKNRLGYIEFKVNGIMQERLKIEVWQEPALSFDRSAVILPGHIGGENCFVVNSKYELSIAYSNEGKFEVSKIKDKHYTVRALVSNDSNEQVVLGKVEVALKEVPDSKIEIDIYQRKATASQTIMFYFLGTHLELYKYYSSNISKILEALDKNIQGDARILATFTNTKKSATLYELRYDSILGKAVKEKIKDIDLIYPYGADTFEDIISTMKSNSPAEKYALIIGSHGHGWTPKHFVSSSSARLRKMGYSYPSELWKKPHLGVTRHIGDDTDVQYDIEEVTSAIAANNIKFDYLLFDACFMANVETAYELRNSTDHIIASPCEIMGAGFPYDKVTPYMLTEGGRSYNLDKVCSEYVEHYRSGAGVYTRSACVSITHTAELEELAARVKEVNSKARKSDFSRDNVQYYDGINQKYNPEHTFYDLQDLIEQSCADEATVEAFKVQLAKSVTSLYHTDTFFSDYDEDYHEITSYSGITTSAEVDICHNAWTSTAWYKATH